MILAEELVSAFNLPALKEVAKTKFSHSEVVVETLSEMRRYVHYYSGGFTFWPAAFSHDSPYISAYALYTLAQAKKAGYEVDQKMVERGIQYLRNKLHRNKEYEYIYPYAHKAWLCFDAFAVYVLALWDVKEYADLDRLFRNKDAIPLFGKAYLLKAAHLLGRADVEDVIVKELRNLIRVDPTSAHFEESDPGWLEWIFHSNVRTTAIILQTLLEVKGEDPFAPKIVRWLLSEQKNGRWRTTQENIYVLHALATYLKTYEKEEPDFNVTVRLSGKTLLEDVQGEEFQDSVRVNLP